MQKVNITVTRILPNQHMNSYNTKLILFCLKQTTNSIRTPIEACQAMEALAASTAANAMAIAEIAHLHIFIYGKINKELHFPSFNHQKWISIIPAPEDSQSIA